MIPLPVNIPWKLIGVAALLLAASFAAWRVAAWRNAYEALPKVEEALANEVGCGEGSACAEREAALTARLEHEREVAVGALADELAAVRNRPSVRRVVRLCANPSNLSSPGPASGTDGASSGPGVLSGPAGPDIGPELSALAREADEVSARLRALQSWNKSLLNEPGHVKEGD